MYENPEAERRELQRKALLPSRVHAFALPPGHRLGALTGSEQKSLNAPSPRKRVGVHRALNIDLNTAGRWESAGVWRLEIASDGAESLRLHLTDFHAAGGLLWIHDGAGDGAQVFGPWTGDGPWGDGDFWTDLVVSDRLVLEYESSRRELPFRIAAVAHGAQLLDGKAQSALGAAASCNLDVSCYPEWANTAKAVGRYTFEQDGGSYLCSGTLLNVPNTASTPYFLTADHCVSDQAGARSVNVFWFYQTPACRGTAPDPRSLPRSNGSTYVVGTGRPGGDVTLLRLTSVPSGVTFAGWTAEPPALGTRVTGIHHPSGDYKRISFAALRPASTRDADSYWGAFWEGGGLTEGGSSGSGLFLNDGRLVGTLSHGPKYDTAAEYCAALPFADNYGRFSAYYPLLRQYLEGGGGTTPPDPSPGGGSVGGVLSSGVPASFRIGPVANSRIYNGTEGFRINVPAGATRLEIRLSTTTASADVDLFARFGTDVVVTNGSVVSDHASEGATGDEVIVVTPASTPTLRAGTYYVALGIFTSNITAQGTLTATVTVPAAPPPTGGNALVSGAARAFRLGPITGSGALFRGANSYTVQVPAGATALEIQVTTTTPRADVDLFARAGEDVGLENGNVVADHRSESATGNESLRITSASSPPLRPGTYYIALGLFTSNVTAEGTITATVRTAEPPPASGGSAVALTSGVARNVPLTPVAVPTLLTGGSSYRIDVPAGAQRLDIRLATPGRSDVDLDLYARFGQPVSLSEGRIQADHRSEGTAADETIAITPSSAPPLRAGAYYIHLGIFTTGETISATLTATVSLRDTPPPPTQTGNLLTSGQARNYALPAVTSPRLFTGESGFRIEVPQGATRLVVRVATPNPTVDVDLYVRGLAEPAFVNGRVASDGSGTGTDGNETVTISGAALRPGTYYIALALFTTGVDANGTITATVTTEATSSVTLTSGVPARFRAGPVTGGTIYFGARGFRVTVPEGATRLELRLSTETPDADVDLFARAERDVAVENGSVVSDYASEGLTGSELIVITPDSTPALRPGTYFVALGLFTNNIEATGTLTATVSTPATPPASSGGALLASGVASKFTFGPVSTPTLYNGGNSFRIVVPEGASRLDVRLASDTPSVDTDLYVRRDADVDLADGAAVADFESSGPLGNEQIVVQGAALRPGTYYISVALFTRNAVASGSITATITRGGISAPVKKEPVEELRAKPLLKKIGEAQTE